MAFIVSVGPGLHLGPHLKGARIKVSIWVRTAHPKVLHLGGNAHSEVTRTGCAERISQVYTAYNAKSVLRVELL